MAEINVEVEDGFLDRLKGRLGTHRNVDVARDALTLLNWAADQRLAGREIVSLEGGAVHARLGMPVLEGIAALKG